MKTIIVFADGGSRYNPGPAACGYVIYATEERFGSTQEVLEYTMRSQPVYSGGDYLGETTNNVAEWSGVIHGLRYAINYSAQGDVSHEEDGEDLFGMQTTPSSAKDIEVFIFLDSQLVVKQITGEYKVKQPHLKPLHAELIALVKPLKVWHIDHIYRTYNKLADAEVNKVLDSKA